MAPLARNSSNLPALSGSVARLKAFGVFSCLASGALLLLAACGGSDGAPTPTGQQMQTSTTQQTVTPVGQQTETPAGAPEPAASVIDPCALLSKAEVEAALGSTVSEPEPEDTGLEQLVSCNYNDPAVPGLHTVFVSVMVLGDASEARDWFESYAKDVERTPVDGIGEDAYWLGAPFDSLEVLTKNFNVSVHVSANAPGGRDPLAVAQELARIAIERLP